MVTGASQSVKKILRQPEGAIPAGSHSRIDPSSREIQQVLTIAIPADSAGCKPGFPVAGYLGTS